MSRADKTEVIALATLMESLTRQICREGRHPDWYVDSEFAHECPWCFSDHLLVQLAQQYTRAIKAAADAIREDPACHDPDRSAYTSGEKTGLAFAIQRVEALLDPVDRNGRQRGDS